MTDVSTTCAEAIFQSQVIVYHLTSDSQVYQVSLSLDSEDGVHKGLL